MSAYVSEVVRAYQNGYNMSHNFSLLLDIKDNFHHFSEEIKFNETEQFSLKENSLVKELIEDSDTREKVHWNKTPESFKRFEAIESAGTEV